MNYTSDFPLFIASAFSLASFVVFFFMAYNVSKLKKDVSDIKDIAMQYAKTDTQKITHQYQTPVKKEITPWICKHCNAETTVNEDVCEKCGKQK